MLRPLLVLIVVVLAIAGAACVLNGQPTPPDGAKGGADASGNQDSGAAVPIQFGDAAVNESTTSDASTDAVSDAFDPNLDASADAQGDGG
ncbi:MAG: hypothetical protein KBF88_06650 [Polyangiaceae bacterium]|nr:hypothetical protein [Polyangiaceae bacterium]